MLITVGVNQGVLVQAVSVTNFRRLVNDLRVHSMEGVGTAAAEISAELKEEISY